MAEWPVRIVEKLDHSWLNENGTPKAVKELQAEPASIVGGQQGYLMNCPHCGMVWMLDDGRRSVNVQGDRITMSPSILCRQCGGHYWLTDGVLREV